MVTLNVVAHWELQPWRVQQGQLYRDWVCGSTSAPAARVQVNGKGWSATANLLDPDDSWSGTGYECVRDALQAADDALDCMVSGALLDALPPVGDVAPTPVCPAAVCGDCESVHCTGCGGAS